MTQTVRPVAAEGGAPAPSAARAARMGFLQALPFLLVLVPFSILFGVVATAAGLDIVQTVGFSIVVLAGASQFSAVQLMSDQAPVLIVLASSLAINLRMAMYSASLTPWIGRAAGWQRAVIAYVLVDQTYGMAIQQFERRPDLTVAERVAYVFGASPVLCLPWMLFTYVGATAGQMIPADWPLDFAVPITFLAMIAPMLRTLAHVAAALVAVLSALALSGLPSGTGVLVAGALGMAAGAAVETWQVRRGKN
ncbi:AzlC family ABC transporter permease [Paracoccus sp. (in: a-proteobacteria)]|uniref:AzlC family ABC transporter permease n=1 Tax=Paracoccus sp. TaxID=267 RepID=UPI0026E025B1|nr:AzlC family ABC transporter permease [Paracoccus sp. (in: a-proteobacteria)]MDO5370812.1 AzlC family ABC transporter permease [Paracoccus sp. (in: a-proteobacteria)]